MPCYLQQEPGLPDEFNGFFKPFAEQLEMSVHYKQVRVRSPIELKDRTRALAATEKETVQNYVDHISEL